MTNNDHVRRSGEITDTELNQLLAAGNRGLLDHIEATANPELILTTIMTQSTQPSAMMPILATSKNPAQIPAALMISTRIRAHELVSALAVALDLALEVWADLNWARSSIRARDIARDLDHRRSFALDLASTLDSDLARELARALDRAFARALGRGVFVRPLDDAVRRALDLAHELASTLDAQHLDASDTDLSDMEIRHLDALDGVLWTNQTTWPPSIANQVRVHSQEIRPGVYQVRLGNTPGQHSLVTA
jgi:hypothetical protein